MSTTPATPHHPKFVSLEETEPQGARFRLVSYNILAQVYVKSSNFPHSPSACLKWKARSKAVLAVLKNLGADFLCLQEVDEYESFYKGNMESCGYSSIYIQRTGQKRDGCGIFFKHDSAELILQETIDYNDLVNSIQHGTVLSDDIQNDEQDSKNKDAKIKSDVSGSMQKVPQDRGDPIDPRVRLKRDCVGIMGAFKLKDYHNHIVIVANTHIYWDPEWADVKLAQAKYLLSRLAQFKALVSDRFECASSLIVAGDFNSTPGDKVYECLISGNPLASSGTVAEGSEDAPIPLRTAYGSTSGEPKFTNCTPDFTDTLDYIFFSPSESIKPVSLLELPEFDPSDVGGLPNFSHPSDHLPIGVEFEIFGGL
ncbi:carbon catabolite repressor protein 4 homolog 4 isoform X1 [Morus notabilis]|uniref:carbon catabolite repressor protein 4 homolog 4 isoform X1 n=1 Tax=Morus notabilis TaxID=981085 RepID=UPI000CED4FB4|nr:carbon catabolite repressor protein 4 homolog 4 isoform X1 [Morus notabilis]